MHNHFEEKSDRRMVEALHNAESLIPTTWDGRNAKRNRIHAIIAELTKRGALIVEKHVKRHRNGSRHHNNPPHQTVVRTGSNSQDAKRHSGNRKHGKAY